jgi:hypothetical protein
MFEWKIKKYQSSFDRDVKMAQIKIEKNQNLKRKSKEHKILEQKKPF